MGVDRATLLHISAPTSSLAVARGLAAVCTRENPSLVLLGKQAIDSDLGTTGPILGGLLGWPQALAASRIDVDVSTSSATVTQEVEGGLETVR